MKINEILKFNRDAFFDGAVQIDWFYDKEKREEVSKSYVFHGKEYHGMDKKDNLIDTAGYVKRIVEKLYIDKNSNRFLLTIAGYGTGKSHLGVTLATLLKDRDIERELVLEKIKDVDTEAGSYIENTIGKKNLVITLNGMNDFNLNYQILKNAKIALKVQNVDISFLEDMTKAYETAEHFLERNYELFSDEFLKEAKKYKKYSLQNKSSLKKLLLSNLRIEQEAFDIVNEIYKMMTSNYIKWDEGISAGEILTKINQKVCIEERIFDNIVIIFDEFGRFIEYAGVAGVLAGESALQQIFESVQNANKNILFIGLIQSDLNAYLARVEKSSNIIRYVGRYETSEKIYISSNLETILASLIIKKDQDKFDSTIGNRLAKYEGYYNKIYESINRWLPNSTHVWKNKNLFDKVIKEGSYPLNPFTVWILANSSSWMQQRSTLTFAEEVFNKYGDKDVFDEKLVQIYPIELIESKFLDELINSEEKGVQNSQHCTTFKMILQKYDAKLSKDQKKILEAILVSNIGKFKFYDKGDNIIGLRYLSGVVEEIEDILKSLENEFGVISFDKTINRYELIAEGNGLNEFRMVFAKHKMINRISTIKLMDEDLIEDLGLNKAIEPVFPLDNGIKTNEWNGKKQFIDSRDLSEVYIRGLVQQHIAAIDGESLKGIILFLYCDSQNKNIQELKEKFERYNTFNYPIIIAILDDTKDEMKDAYEKYKILKSFDNENKKKFREIYKEEIKKAKIQLIRSFSNLSGERLYLNENGLEKINERLTNYYDEVLKKNYTKPIPFVFDGFDKTGISKAVTNYKQILELFINGNYANSQVIQALNSEVQSKLRACLRVDSKNSWGVFTVDYRLIKPENKNLSDIVDEIEKNIEESNEVVGRELLEKYLKAPYGMNLYQLNLMMVYILTRNKNIKIQKSLINIKRLDLMNKLFPKNKKDLEFFFSCKFSMIELNSREKFEKLFKEIRENKFSENCSTFEEKMGALADQEEVDVDLQDDYVLAKEKIRVGYKVEKTIKENIEKFKQYIRQTKLKFDLYQSMLYTIEISKFNRLKFEGGYKLSKERENLLLDQIKEIEELIKEVGPRYIENIRFGIREISEKKKKYNNIANALDKKGFKELSVKLLYKTNEIIEEINREEEFKEISSNVEALIMNLKILPDDYAGLNRGLEQINQIKETLEDENIPVSIRNKNLEKIEKVSKSIEKRIKDIDIKQNEVIESYVNLESNKDILDLEGKIKEIQKLNIKNEKMIEIEKIVNDINIYNKIKKEIYNITDSIESIEERIELLDELGSFQKILLKVLAEKKIELATKDKRWREQYLEISITGKTLEWCNNWLNETSLLPKYLTNEAVEKYRKIKNEIEEIIAGYKIDGVVMMFDKLSNEEKQACLKLLMNKI